MSVGTIQSNKSVSVYLIKKAQSFLEYSILIAVTVAVLILMQYYLSRNLQGFLKSHVDNLGGQKLAQTKYSPGSWYGSGADVSQLKTWGFDLEFSQHSVSFSVLTGGSKKTDASVATGISRPAD